MSDWRSHPHRRLNPLTGDWVLVSPHRGDRPWLGERVDLPHADPPPYDPSCYLCPGNRRANGRANPQYGSVFAFENDYAALLSGEISTTESSGDLFVARAERGICRVLCFSPQHDRDLGSMPLDDVREVVGAWAHEYETLSSLPYVSAVTAFENRGASMGASNPHPHGQVWADSSVPNELAKETASLERYAAARDTCLLCDYVAAEEAAAERIVFGDDAFVAIVPFWAVWPFELLLLPRRHRTAIARLEADERTALAAAIGRIVRGYDRLFSIRCPYSMGFHQAPCDREYAAWHLHAHYYPPLLRSASIRKYMVGYEMLAQPQRDITPENAAARLRDAVR